MKRAVFFIPLLILAGACKDAPVRAAGEGSESSPTPASPEPRQVAVSGSREDASARSADCPAFSRAARVASQPIVDGAEVVFWTSDDTAMLRRRVSTLSLPSVAPSAEFRTDNIHNGIRLVFVSDNAAEVVPLRLAVHSYAKEIAARCGVTYAQPKAPKKRSDPTSAGGASSPAKAATPSKASTAGTAKQVKPATAPSAVPPAPKPPQAPTAPVKKPSGPIADPFAPPAPPSPPPPSNPFK